MASPGLIQGAVGIPNHLSGERQPSDFGDHTLRVRRHSARAR